MHCGIEVGPLPRGSYRNHCPSCLCSRHVDVLPGDRAARCRGLMRARGVDSHPAKGHMLVHRCVECGFVRRNRVAPDDELESLLQVMKYG
ncbi:hypothetical protein GCM10022248_74910 [Nonomuraea soli]